MIMKKPTYEELEARLAEAEAAIGALRGEQVDAVIGKEHVFLLRLEETEKKLRASEALCHGLFENANIAIFRETLDGRILEINPEFSRMFGFDGRQQVREMVSRTGEFFADPERRDELVQRLLQGETVLGAENLYRRRDGSTFIGTLSLHAAMNEYGDISHIEGFIEDITERKRAELELQRLSQQRQLALDAASMGWWHYDPVTRVASWDNRYSEIFGVAGYQCPNDEILKRLHPEDLPGVWAKVEAALDPMNPQPYSAHFRINLPDGSMRWIEAHGIASFEGLGENRRATSFVGTVADITERKRAEEALREAKYELEIKVRERTAELQRINERLKEENRERMRTEHSLRLEEARLDALLYLSRMSEAPLKEITAFTLEHAIALTHSKIGFLGFLNEDESVYTLHAVSKDVVKECNVTGDPLQWHVVDAGIWADAIRERRTLFINDYSKPHPRKKGLPPGHPYVERFMVVPLSEGERIVAVAGVGNKASDYDKSDERQIVLLLSGMWGCVQKNRSREELEKTYNELEEKVKQRTAELVASTAALQVSEKRLVADLNAMTRLQKVGTLFVREGNLEPVLGEIVDTAISISGADFGNIQLLNPKTSELQIVAQRGFPKWWIDFWKRVCNGKGTCGTALERGERVIVEDVEQSPIFIGTPALEIQLKAGVRAVQSTPLVSRSGRPIGMFSTHFKTQYRPDDHALRLLDMLARHAADIIERAQTEEALQQLNAQLEQRVAEQTDEIIRAYEAVRLERQRLNDVLDTLPAYVVLLTPDYHVPFANSFFEGRFGRSVGRRCYEYLFDRTEPCETCETFKVLKTNAPHHWEWLGPDGRNYDIYDFPFKDIDGSSLIMEVGLDITERKKAETELLNSREQLRHLSEHLQSVREEERTRIAREIHDELGQILTSLKIDASMLAGKLPADEKPLFEKAKLMIKQIDESIRTVKKICSELRPTMLDHFGLQAAIEWQAEDFQKRTGIECEVSFHPEDIALDQDISIVIFRIFQEALTNIMRHAGATEVKASLKAKDSMITLEVKDNGKGITEEEIANPNSFGLLGIRERINFLGGDVTISGIRNRGTTIEVNLPFRKKGNGS